MSTDENATTESAYVPSRALIPPEADALIVTAPDGREAFRIGRDGALVFGDGFGATKAAASLIAAIRELLPAVELTVAPTPREEVERQYAHVVTAILRVLDETEWDGWPEPAKWRLRQRIVNAVRDAVKAFTPTPPAGKS